MTDALRALRGVAREGDACVLFDRDDWKAVAARPAASLCVRDARAWRRDGEGAWRAVEGDAWGVVRAFVAEGARGSSAPSDGAWHGGVVMLASYDAGRLIERLPSRAADDTRLPELLLFRFDEATVLPPEPAPSAPPAPHDPVLARAPTRSKEFESMVLAAQERVRAGDVFQVNLSHRIEATTTLSAFDLYARLRVANPAPFSAFLASGPLPDGMVPFHVLSSSPERLFALKGGRLEARPIAGTRKRGATAAEDEALKAELVADGKERAEHLMMVDLARNDLGRVARFGSVRVPHLLTVETFRTVHHLVSVVEADLAEGKDVLDAFRALFPGGTITGAPKVRAMEVIEEIEPVRRGVYTGSLGWIAPNGDADLNILIRTLLVRDGTAHLQVGAGIVDESVPEREYHETLAKAKGMLRALGVDAPA